MTEGLYEIQNSLNINKERRMESNRVYCLVKGLYQMLYLIFRECLRREPGIMPRLKTVTMRGDGCTSGIILWVGYWTNLKSITKNVMSLSNGM